MNEACGLRLTPFIWVGRRFRRREPHHFVEVRRIALPQRLNYLASGRRQIFLQFGRMFRKHGVHFVELIVDPFHYSRDGGSGSKYVVLSVQRMNNGVLDCMPSPSRTRLNPTWVDLIESVNALATLPKHNVTAMCSSQHASVFVSKLSAVVGKCRKATLGLKWRPRREDESAGAKLLAPTGSFNVPHLYR